MTFAHPVIAVAAVMVAAAVATGFAVLSAARRRALLRIGNLPELWAMTASLSPRRRWIKHALVVTAVALVGLALAGPEIQPPVSVTPRGIDLAFAVDHSRSMLAGDIAPTRLAFARHQVDLIVDALAGDRVAMVAFAGAAAHFPLTFDHRAATLLFAGLTPEDLPPGSDVAAGIKAAHEALVAPATDPLGGHRARALVLFTDGEQTTGDGAGEIAAAVSDGIYVIVVGVGTRAGDLIPGAGSDGITRLDEASLAALARAAGGADHLFIAGGDHAFVPGAVIDALFSLEVDGGGPGSAAAHPVVAWFLLPALMLLAIEAWLSERRR